MSEYLAPWAFGHNQNEQVILGMYNATKASEYTRKVKRIMKSEAYKSIFPDIVMPTSKYQDYENTSTKFEIVNSSGFFMSAGVNGGIAGTPAKIALLDDVIKNKEEAFSKTYRNRTYDWFTDELESRLHNDSRVVFTITRRHEDDLAGRLLDRDGKIEDGGTWNVISLPALKENNENPNDPREVGDALFPELHSRERMEGVKAKDPRTFESLYQQRPTAIDGDIFKREWFRTSELDWNFFRHAMSIYVDGAYTTKKSGDPTAIYTYFKHNNQLHVVDVEAVRLSFEDLKAHIKKKVTQFGNLRTTRIRIEGKGPGISLVQSLKKDPNYRMLRVYQDNIPHVDKEARAHATAGFIERGDVLFADAPWNAEYFEQMCAFPNAKHDDMVDCTTAAIRIELLKGDGGKLSKA